MEYKYKLIRDNIPAIMASQGKVCNHATVQNNEWYAKLLRDKLEEELEEWRSSNYSIEELVDISTVLNAIIEFSNVDNEFQRIYAEKLARNGGFNDRIVGFFAKD